MASYAFCNPDSDLFPIFGDEAIPILSIVPIIPREHGAPPCYVILGRELSENVRHQLAMKLFEMWQPECESIEMASEYILEGLPLKTTHFVGVGTDEQQQMIMGSALNMAIRASYQS